MSEFYECTTCHKPFFGGYVDCAIEQEIEDREEDVLDEDHMKCQTCRLQEMGATQQFMCNYHGLRHIQYKCDYCCNAAVYRCRANTYFCEDCHKEPGRLGKHNCGGNASKCPF